MRWALQKLTLVSSLKVTISRASKYSKESSWDCCSSTKREKRENKKGSAVWESHSDDIIALHETILSVIESSPELYLWN